MKPHLDTDKTFDRSDKTSFHTCLSDKLGHTHICTNTGTVQRNTFHLAQETTPHCLCILTPEKPLTDARLVIAQVRTQLFTPHTSMHFTPLT